MNIVSASDDGYLPHFCAMLHSAWLYNPDANYYLLATDISQDNLDLLRGFARQRNIALEIITFGAERTAGLPTRPGFPAATWLRLFVPEAVFASVDRAIYLDADIAVNSKLDDLFTVNMDGKPLAAVPDGMETTFKIERAIHGFAETSIYVNTGVMLLDLAKWRAEKISERIVFFARTTDAELHWPDQSAINVLLEGQILTLEKEWNFFDLRQIAHVPHPRIIHYAGTMKPWNSSSSPFYRLYSFHRNQTPWPLPHGPRWRLARLKMWIKGIRRRIGAWLGIKRYRLMKQDSDRPELPSARIISLALERASALVARTRTAL